MLERSSVHFVRLALSALWLCCLPACFKSNPRVGSETHFMHACAGLCDDGLSCICGACTKACSRDTTCHALSSAASCEAVSADSVACEGSPAPAHACDAICKRDADCDALGTDFTCVAGRCRERTQTAKPASGGTHDAAIADDDAGAGGGASDATVPACVGADCGLETAPLVLLLVDSSGSMERKASCKCQTPGCKECLPDCAKSERNRWTLLLEALTGTYDGYSCVALDRTAANGATFDLGYALPNFVSQGAQRSDGVLDLYKKALRFGLATFDGWDSYRSAPPLVSVADFDIAKSEGVDGLWSYNPAHVIDEKLRRPDGNRIGSFRYPNATTDYFMDTGVRGPNATQGALMVATSALDETGQPLGPLSPADVELWNDQIQLSLLRTTPYGGTPISAALDDLYYFLGSDATLAGERARHARPYVVLITDGYPDDDYRSFGCDCATTDPASNSCGGPPNDPSKMHCPYPTTEEAARTLRCGQGKTCNPGPAERVYVIGYAIDDAMVTARLDAIAIAGGDKSARFATDSDSLRTSLRDVLDEIAAAH